jgi:hypothetical protein
VATALVAGQALLCAVIGWVTFGGHDPARSTTQAAEPRFGPALVVPPASVAPVLTGGPTRSHPKAPDLSLPAPTGPPPSPPGPDSIKLTIPPSRTSAPVSAPVSSAAAPAARPGAPVPSSVDGSLVATPAPTVSPTQEGVVAGEKCDPPDAYGLTVGKVAVRCLPDRNGDLVWQII